MLPQAKLAGCPNQHPLPYTFSAALMMAYTSTNGNANSTISVYFRTVLSIFDLPKSMAYAKHYEEKKRRAWGNYGTRAVLAVKFHSRPTHPLLTPRKETCFFPIVDRKD